MVWDTETGKALISKLLQKCAESGYHPKAWRRAVAVALKKPGKPDYSQPLARAYRLITLLECLGKVLEKVIAKRLTFLAGRLDLVPSNQFGGRSNSSTTDALLTFVNDVHAAWNHDKVTSALTFDIKGYLNFVNHSKLLSALRSKGIPLQIVKWTASFLSNRVAAICIDGIRGELAAVQNGIPQGSPISPILAAYYTADLLDLFRPNPNSPTSTPIPDKPTPVTVLMYVDDGKLTVSSRSLETNVTILKNAYLRVDEWLHQTGLSPDYSKRELMHYTRRRKDKSPSITFEDRDGQRRVVSPEPYVRWLGVYFDRKLSFKHHIKLMETKGTNAVCGLAMLANTVRGLHQTHIRCLYISCVLPKILYAAPVWGNGKANQVKPLAKVQRRALLLMCAAFKTTPTDALEIEASLPPIHLQILRQKDMYAIRLNKLPHTSPIMQRLNNNWRKGKKPTIPPPLPAKRFNGSAADNKKSTPFLDIEKLTSPTHERVRPFHSPPWRVTASAFGERVKVLPHRNTVEGEDPADKTHRALVEELSLSDKNLIVYTDGSLTKVHSFYRSGAAAVLFHKDREVKALKKSIGGRASIYDAEMAGLAMAAKSACRFAKRKTCINHIFIFADNNAAIRSAFDPKPGPAQLYAIQTHHTLRKFLNCHQDNKVTIAWCPGHKNVKGNERADALAKKARDGPCNEPHTATLAHAQRIAKARTGYEWRKEWKASAKLGGYAIANRTPPSTILSKTFRNTPREVFGRLIQCKTNHAYTGEYRRRFNLAEELSCNCGEALQTREHIITQCRTHETKRDCLRKVSRDIWLPTILGERRQHCPHQVPQDNHSLHP